MTRWARATRHQVHLTLPWSLTTIAEGSVTHWRLLSYSHLPCSFCFGQYTLILYQERQLLGDHLHQWITLCWDNRRANANQIRVSNKIAWNVKRGVEQCMPCGIRMGGLVLKWFSCTDLLVDHQNTIHGCWLKIYIVRKKVCNAGYSNNYGKN